MSAALQAPACTMGAPSLLAALLVLRADHARIEPHHEDLCPICRQADAAIRAAQARDHATDESQRNGAQS